jgi:hypothetical protein
VENRFKWKQFLAKAYSLPDFFEYLKVRARNFELSLAVVSLLTAWRGFRPVKAVAASSAEAAVAGRQNGW